MVKLGNLVRRKSPIKNCKIDVKSHTTLALVTAAYTKKMHTSKKNNNNRSNNSNNNNINNNKNKKHS